MSAALPPAFGYLCEWKQPMGMSNDQIIYYGEPGSAIEDDWNRMPEVHKNLPIFTADQMQAYAQQARADLEVELSAHKASRLAYASEFSPNEEGDLDVGSIHQNIRAIKVENKRLREALRIARDHIEMDALRISHCKDAETIAAALKDTK